MIKINLIPPRISKRELQLRSELAIFALVVFLTLTIWIYRVAQITSERDDWQKKIQSHTRNLEVLKPVEKEIEEFKKQREVLKSRQETIEKLVNARTGPARIMSDISRIKPTKLWLTGFTQKDNSLTLTGVADESATVIDFINRLREQPTFESVDAPELKESEGDPKTASAKASGLRKSVEFKFRARVSTRA
ncbi:MAG: PilN domain-containing protein [Deltaproteobacteria bacterium]|nr:PilN domain-containing protein [Deltaproteobacteria bacterium]